MLMLSPQQLESYERDGAVVVDLGLPEDLLVALEAAWLRLGAAPGGTPLYDEPAVLSLLQHESFERIAQQVLRSDAVHIFEIGRSERPAGTADGPNLDGGRFDKHGFQTEWAQGMHSDVQVASDDFDATPRREQLAIWMWLCDVPEDRAAMRVLKGSHRELGDHWREMQRLGDAGLPLPLAHGPRWEAPGEPDARRWAGREPTPMTARRGEALVWSQQVLHSAWHNADVTHPRSGFFASWVAAGVSMGGRSPQQIAGQHALWEELHKRMEPERRHIAMDKEVARRFDEGWEETWPPTLHVRYRL
jgi:hypothetical protein